MKLLTKDDLTQMDRVYFQKLDQKTLIDVACKLRDFSVNLVERLEQNSKNSSKPPSSDSPYQKTINKSSESKDENDNKNSVDDEKQSVVNNDLELDKNSPADDSVRFPGK
ncbi:MAG: hypothetical protein HQK67_08680 [Desulfamplus sp.]|nr:hypothetical protein [Desulfamplus sp.]